MKIAIIDDSSTILKCFTEFATRIGAESISFRNPLVAIRELPEYQPDVVICDYMMFDKDGIETIKSLREGGMTCPMILATAFDDNEPRQQCISEKITFKAKPITLEGFKNMIGESNGK